MRLSGGKTTKDDQEADGNDKWNSANQKSMTCKGRVAHWVIDPMNPYKVLWDMIMGLCYLISMFADPFVFSFHFKPLENKPLNRFLRVLTLIFLINLVVTPVTGVPKDDGVITLDPIESQEDGKVKKKKRKSNSVRKLIRQ